MLNIGYVSNETNTYVRMYIAEFILVEIWITLLHKLELVYIGNYTVIYTIETMDEKCENCAQEVIDT